MGRVAIITDSASDLTAADAAALPGVMSIGLLRREIVNGKGRAR